MTLIDIDYYNHSFCGRDIPDNQFPRLAATASDIISLIARRDIYVEGQAGVCPELEPHEEEYVKRAAAYQTELLYIQGGVDAVAGYAPALSDIRESLGSYSVARSPAGCYSIGGIPVSALAVLYLRKAGLLSRQLRVMP